MTSLEEEAWGGENNEEPGENGEEPLKSMAGLWPRTGTSPLKMYLSNSCSSLVLQPSTDFPRAS